MEIASMWASMAAWFTPTVLFCVLNLVIATIFIASNFKSPPGQLAPAPSLLERVNSVSSSSFYTAPEPESTGFSSTSPLSRAPSILERVKSIDFSFSSFYDQSRPEPEQTHYGSPGRLTRAPSLLQRVKSIKLNPFHTESEQLNSLSPSSVEDSGYTVSKHSDPDPDVDPVVDHLVTRRISGKTPAGRMHKSRSEKRFPGSDEEEEDVDRRRPATMKASNRAADESVDAKADDFINRFKQQLKLQRLDSLARLKEMLNRGT